MARDHGVLDEDDVGDDDNIDNTYLTFAVGSERFALRVAYVIEIVRLQRIFALPDVPHHIRGVINLRGKVIPLLDVRARFGLEQVPYGERTVVVVIEVADSPTGLIVDRVFDILELPPQELEAAPTTHQSAHKPLVSSILKHDDQVTFIVDVPKLVGAILLDGVSAPASPSALSRERLSES